MNREQRTLENLQAWAERGNDWAKRASTILTAKLLPGHPEIDQPRTTLKATPVGFEDPNYRRLFMGEQLAEAYQRAVTRQRRSAA